MTAHNCVVCKEDADESSCVHDSVMGGMVCAECRRNLMWAQAYLKKEGIAPNIQPKDINQSNFHRFQSGYHETT